MSTVGNHLFTVSKGTLLLLLLAMSCQKENPSEQKESLNQANSSSRPLDGEEDIKGYLAHVRITGIKQKAKQTVVQILVERTNESNHATTVPLNSLSKAEFEEFRNKYASKIAWTAKSNGTLVSVCNFKSDTLEFDCGKSTASVDVTLKVNAANASGSMEFNTIYYPEIDGVVPL